MMKPVWASLALGMLATAIACGHGDAAAQATPSPAGQISTPLAIASAASIPVGAAPRALSSLLVPASLGISPPFGVVDGVAIFAGERTPTQASSRTLGVRTADGRLLWNIAGTIDPQRFVAGDASLVLERQTPTNGNVLALIDARTGATQRTLQDAYASSIYDGVLYARKGEGFGAFDARTLAPYWFTLGENGGATGRPRVVGNVLLQSFVNDGAILTNDISGIDVRNGHVLWGALSNVDPLGYANGSVYLDGTWQPSQMDNYIPLTIDRVDIATGKKRDSFTYAPDPARHASTYLQNRNTAPRAFVSGGFVYVAVEDSWYRYRADTQPASPVSLGNLTVEATFENGELLIATPGGVAIGQSLPDKLVLHHVANGAVHAPVVARIDGRIYVLAGSTLLAFDSAGRPTPIGDVRCTADASISLWTAHAAVACIEEARLRAYVFSDVPTAPLPAHGHPQRTRPPAFRLRFTTYPIEAPISSGFREHWQMGPIASRSDRGVAITLVRDNMGGPNAIAFVERNGLGRVTTLTGGLEPVRPANLVVDLAGTTWFNDGYHDTISALDPSGRVRVTVGMAPTPLPTTPPGSWMHPPRRYGYGFRIALGPDGAAWYARTHPQAIIARADGTRTFSVPTSFGPVIAIHGGTDALWFVTPKEIGRMTLDGTFSRISVPPSVTLQNVMPEMPMAAGPDGTMWIGGGSRLLALHANAPARIVNLPNVDTEAMAAAIGCDGSLYVSERGPALAVVRPSGAVEEYLIDGGISIGGMTRTSDCALWFSGEASQGHAIAGTFSLVPVPGRRR